MSHRNSISVLSCFLAVGLFCVSGCGPSGSSEAPTKEAAHDHEGHADHDDDHDHDFENLGEAVAEIDELSTEITTAFTSGKPESAHDALHHIAEVLEATETTISKSSMSEDLKAESLKAVENLFDSFTTVDETMHGDGESDPGKSFDEVKGSIEASLTVLEAAAKQ